jgi:hypothetical protein
METPIGSLRRKCLDQVMVLGVPHLRLMLGSHFAYYHRSRKSSSSRKDMPEPRAKRPPEDEFVVEIAEVWGLLHRY